MSGLHEAVISDSKECDFCSDGTEADYDGKTKMGPWAYMCETHFQSMGIGLGSGKGQKLVTRAEED